jgi:hypothetical protein
LCVCVCVLEFELLGRYSTISATSVVRFVVMLSVLTSYFPYVKLGYRMFGGVQFSE